MTHQKRIEKGLFWDKPLTLVGGCTPVSPGCDNCWGSAEAHMRSFQSNPKIKQLYQGLTDPDGNWTGDIKLHEQNLTLLQTKKPYTWAVWNDLFHESVPDKFLNKAFDVFTSHPHQKIIIITKRHKRMRNYTLSRSLTPNILGLVTVENQHYADLRIPALLESGFRYKGIIIEPMLGPVDILKSCDVMLSSGDVPAVQGINKYLHQVIIGGETGHHARPLHPDWVKSILSQCESNNIPVFFKSWGEWAAEPRPGGSVNLNSLADNQCAAKSSNGGHYLFRRVGKKNTGRLVGGMEYNQLVV